MSLNIQQIAEKNGHFGLVPQSECTHEKVILWYDEQGGYADMVRAAYGRCTGCWYQLPISPVIIPAPAPKIWRPLAKALIKNREKDNARNKLNLAKRQGKVIQEPCQVCGNPDSEGHHTDYSKPLDVIWLCREHHIQADKAMRAGKV